MTYRLDMKREKRIRNPKDNSYPQYSLRIPEARTEQFERIKAMVEDIFNRFKASQKDDEKTINRNDIMIEALEKGLKELKRETKG